MRYRSVGHHDKDGSPSRSGGQPEPMDLPQAWAPPGARPSHCELL